MHLLISGRSAGGGMQENTGGRLAGPLCLMLEARLIRRRGAGEVSESGWNTGFTVRCLRMVLSHTLVKPSSE